MLLWLLFSILVNNQYGSFLNIKESLIYRFLKAILKSLCQFDIDPPLKIWPNTGHLAPSAETIFGLNNQKTKKLTPRSMDLIIQSLTVKMEILKCWPLVQFYRLGF